MADWVEQPIVWGPINEDGCRIGLKILVKETSTQVEVEIRTRIQVSTDADYVLINFNKSAVYFDNLSSSGSATTYYGSPGVYDGDYSSSNGFIEYGYDWQEYTYAKDTVAKTRYIYAKLTNPTIDGSLNVSTTYTIPKLEGYTVSYDANGGSGEPSAQFKSHGVALTLSSTKPTRTGYTFQGWATSAGGSVTYAAGASYTTNASITLYAVWKANTYTVSYNANGGTGAPANQTKTYDVPLTLSYTKPTRTNYAFVGWGTSASATTVAYTAGDSYTANAGVTLYAIWTLSYTKPRITDLKVARCNDDKTLNDQGTYALVTFDWSSDREITGIKIEWKPSAGDTWSSKQLSQSGTSGSVSECIGSNAISIEYVYDIKITVADSFASMEAIRSLAGTKFVIDLLGGGNGIAFGAPASMSDYMDVNFYTRFRQPVHFDNSRGIFGKTTDAEEVSLLYLNSSNETYVAYGGYNNRVGRTNLYGNELNLYSNGDVNINPSSSGITALSGTTINASATSNINLSANTNINLTAKNNVYVASPLHLKVTTDASGTANNNPALIIGPTSGTHLEFDGNEIISKGSGTTTGSLWINSDGGQVYINNCKMAANTVLWSGAYFMSASQTATLSQSISSQANGIVLLWSYYDGSAQDYAYTTTFLPKYLVYVIPSDGGITVRLNTRTYNTVASKYVYMTDTAIRGHDSNSSSAWNSTVGVTITPRNFVLRYIIGV